MYQIELYIRNPQNGDSKLIRRRFDETAFTQAKWNGAFPVVASVIEELITRAAEAAPDSPNAEPLIW